MKTIFVIVFLSFINSNVHAQLGDNLLYNPGAESGFEYWTANSGGWWQSSTSHTGSYGWISTNGINTMSQVVDLIAKGYSADILDGSPSIATGIYVYPGWASVTDKGTITIKVELFDGIDELISPVIYISNNEVLPLTMLTWEERSTTISGYSTGLRKIKFTFIGSDALEWGGFYGPIFDDANLQLDGPLPVELISFHAVATECNIILYWKTATEVNNHGFEIEKAAVSSLSLANSQQLNAKSWSKIGFVEGSGTTNSPKQYSFIDKNINAGKYLYRLKQIDRDGKFSYSQTVEVTFNSTPKIFALEQNYPNPFNPGTVISYQLPVNSYVTLKVYDAIGREVATLVNEVKEAGTYSATFNASKLSSGIYFYTLKTEKYTAMKKLMLMK